MFFSTAIHAEQENKCEEKKAKGEKKTKKEGRNQG